MNTCSARKYTMFATAQFLRNVCKQRPSNKVCLDSSAMWEVRRQYNTGADLLMISLFCCSTQCSKWAGICRYHTGTSFCSCTYQYILYLPSSHFLAVNPCFAFKKYTGASKFPFRALIVRYCRWDAF
jgi:hypothetical protein